jgi:TolA-binding protein
MPSKDELANSMLSQAQLLINNGRSDLATDKLNKLIEKYPETAAAGKARTLLLQLNNAQ